LDWRSYCYKLHVCVLLLLYLPHDIYVFISKFFSHFDEKRNTSKRKERYYKIKGGLVSIILNVNS
jgi:hypothetical protein